MNHKLLVGVLLLLCSKSAVSEVEYTETQDDFSNDKVYSLKIPSTEGASAVLFISCYPKAKLNVQLAITGTMFPDDMKDGGMIISTTHKFDKSEAAITSDWYMNVMKYKNSWYRGDLIKFAQSAAMSGQLNLRLNKRNDIYKFNLAGAPEPLEKILVACGKQKQ